MKNQIPYYDSIVHEQPTYAKDRLIQYFGTLENAKNRGYTITTHQDIFISYANIDGTPITYTPQKVRDSIQKTEKNRKYGSMGDGAEYLQALENSEIYGRTRLSKGNIRYLAPSKKETDCLFVSFRPTIELIQAYKNGSKVKTLYLFEGEFKADMLSQNDVMSASYSGISTFRLTDDLKKVITTCQIEKIILCYDGDLLNLTKNLTEDKIVNQRPLNFFHSAKKFAAQLYEWTPQEQKVRLVFCNVNPTQPDKAADDLILNNPDQKSKVIESLKSHKDNEYFSFLTLPKTSYENKLISFFHLDSVRTFYKLHKGILQDNPFKFKQDTKTCLYRFCNLRKTIITETRPFNIEVGAIAHFKAHKHLGKSKKQQKEIFALLDEMKKIFLKFPTGTGKTTIAEKYGKHYLDNDPTGKGKVYIIAPITRLGEQIAKDTKKKFIYAKTKDFTEAPNGKEQQEAQRKKDAKSEALRRLNAQPTPHKYKEVNVEKVNTLTNKRLKLQERLLTEKDPNKIKALNYSLKVIRQEQREYITPIKDTPKIVSIKPYHNQDVNYDERIIICTYDCIKNGKVSIDTNDLLIVDEAHDIVNQFCFRPETMRALYNAFKVAKKVICLSATPNNNFIKNEGFKLITGDVKKRMQVNYITHILGKNKSIKQGIISELLNSDLSEQVSIQGNELFNNRQELKTHVVFINNKSDLQDIRTYLIDLGFITIEETALLTSETQNSDKTFNNIVNSRLIGKKIRVVFTTCLLSEGINIENQNIGKILIGGIKCLDLLRQFPARFRKILNLDVYLFWKSQTKINSRYFEPTERATRHLLINAKAHAKILQDVVNEAKENNETFESDNYHSDIYDLAYVDRNNEVKIDRLKIYAKEKERQVSTIPIDILISELAQLDHVSVTDCEERADDMVEVKKQLKEIADNRKEIQAKKKQDLLTDLQKNKDITLLGLHKALKHSKHHNLAKEISNLIPLSKDEHERLKPEIETKKEEILQCDCFAKVAKQYLGLLAHTSEPVLLIQTIDTKKDFKILARSLKWTKLIAEYKDKNKRQRKLNLTQRADAKGLITIQKEVIKRFGSETFKTHEIYGFIKNMFNVKFVNELGELKTVYSTISENKLNMLFLALFKAEKVAPDTYTNIQRKTYENTLKTTQME